MQKIAYFSMEFGVRPDLRNYSGGLGILAGDHLKSASDLALPLVAFGLAYRFGYFQQRLSSTGHQEALRMPIDFNQAPLSLLKDSSGHAITFSVQAPNRMIDLQAWKCDVGQVPLYLLDADVPSNSELDRSITDQLYSGDHQHRLIQEYVLAMGGLALIKKLLLPIEKFHMNEGHTAFIVLGRLEEYMGRGLDFNQALQQVRSSTLFTTHTPVPAGHDVFSVEMTNPYLHLFTKIGIERCQFLASSLDNTKDHFSMTGLAARGSSYINGVSQIHAGLTKKMFAKMDVAPISGITNGVHASTWVSPELKKIFQLELGPDWLEKQSQVQYWTRLKNVSNDRLWEAHQSAKKRLIQFLKNKGSEFSHLNENYLIATFARRFATYKRASLLFSDLQRLQRILNQDQPMVILFAGKAHPRDLEGQALISQVVEHSKSKGLSGKILFVENYEIDSAQLLVSGSDIWVNNPIRPLEASGTSGMKAAMNGCLNLSVPDGWWAEAYNGKNGWSINTPDLLESEEIQTLKDSQEIYRLLEEEVRPAFIDRNRWVSMMKESIATVLPVFNTHRMVEEYAKVYNITPTHHSDIGV